jgi:hypothetical protein
MAMTYERAALLELKALPILAKGKGLKKMEMTVDQEVGDSNSPGGSGGLLDLDARAIVSLYVPSCPLQRTSSAGRARICPGIG